MLNNIQLKTELTQCLNSLTDFINKHDLYINVYNDKEFVSAQIIGNALETSMKQNKNIKNTVKNIHINKALSLPATTELIQIIILINNEQINSIDYIYDSVDIPGVLKSKMCFKMIINIQYSNYKDCIAFLTEEIKNYFKLKQ